MNSWVIPTADQMLRCRLVQETRLTVLKYTGVDPRIMFASREFLKVFDYEHQTLVEVYGVRMFMDEELMGISCYFRIQ